MAEVARLYDVDSERLLHITNFFLSFIPATPLYILLPQSYPREKTDMERETWKSASTPYKREWRPPAAPPQ